MDHGSVGRAPTQGQALTVPDQPYLDILRQSAQWHGCSDPRDALFSRVALASDAEEIMQVDYRVPVEDLYMRFAVACIQRSGSVKVMQFATSTPMRLPSWVPDWSSPAFAENSHQVRAFREEIEALPWTEKHLPRISVDSKELIVQGRTLYTVGSRSRSKFALCIAALFSLFNVGGSRKAYTFSENASTGDLVCLLRSYPSTVHLRPKGSHFVLVGRNMWNEAALRPRPLWPPRPYVWHLMQQRFDKQLIGSIPEEAFNIQ